LDSVAVTINNRDAHFSSRINLLLIYLASAFTDLPVGYECRVTYKGGVSKLGLSLFQKENGSTLDYL
jgi:hypothetical protein